MPFLVNMANNYRSYGEHGHAIIGRYVRSQLANLEAATGVSRMEYGRGLDNFIEQIAASQITCELIKEDYECTEVEARKMAWLSEPYGQTEFPYNSDCEVLARLQGRQARTEIMNEIAHSDSESIETLDPDPPTKIPTPRRLRSRSLQPAPDGSSDVTMKKTRVSNETQGKDPQTKNRPKPRRAGLRKLA